MRPDLPWNVAGIPSEAREAARAAARREGLSVGEWLTRRILRSFADAGDEDELTRDNLAKTYRPEDEAQRRDTDDMLERVSRSGSETSDVYRRIEEQLRGVARRMESAERTQSEHNRVLSKAATEMNIAAREQAQAFDQLGSHVVGLADRIERVERANAAGGMKDAIKGLHTGLSRLADQITQNAGQSAAQVSQLAHSLEALANRLNQTRSDSEDTTNHLEARVSLLDGRIDAVEKTTHSTSQALERALEKLEARAAHDQQSAAASSGVIERLEEDVARLEARGPDPDIEKRLCGIERNLGDLIARLDGGEPATARTIEDSLRKLLARVEATENRQRDTVSEFRSALGDTNARLAAIEGKAGPATAMPAAPPPAADFGAPASFDLPPFPDVPTPGAPPPFAAQNDAFAPALDAAPPFAAQDPFAPAGGAYAAPPATDSFLSAARRSAQAAAMAAEAEQSSKGFGWPLGRASGAEGSGRSRTVLMGLVVLIAVALIAGLVLSQSNFGSPSRPSGLAPQFSEKTAAPAPQEATPLHALSPQADEVPSPPAAAPRPSELQQAAPKPVQATPAKQAAAPQTAKDVRTAPVHAVPEPVQPKAAAASQTARPQPALDRLSQLATAGNPKAETIVGLKYLNGDGTAVNETQAAAWLQKAAEAGEPVAQYRLGTLYEHGKGVAADPVKASHWYLAAAMQGNRKAMHNIAVAYAEGIGLKKDLTEAVRWFSKAASLGLTDSQFNLAVLYERGQGVPQSLVDAYKWYSVAAAGGDAESKSRRDALATQLSADDRAAAQHAAEGFKAQSPDPHANVPPQLSDLQ